MHSSNLLPQICTRVPDHLQELGVGLPQRKVLDGQTGIWGQDQMEVD